MAERRYAAGLLDWWEHLDLLGGCIYCGRPWDEVDHLIPRALGGADLHGNLFPACWDCNRTKSDTSPAMWKIVRLIQVTLS